MKKIACCIVIVAFSASRAAAASTCISEYFHADALAKTGHLADAATAMEHAFHLAVDEGNQPYVGSAGSRAAFMRYALDQVPEAGRLAREVLDKLVLSEPKLSFADATQRADLFGLVERGLLMEGQIGAAWQANRAAAETLRQKPVGVNADGPAIRVAELDTLPREMRDFAWRLLEREAEYLDLAGHSPEALAMLAATANKAAAEMPTMPVAQRFYPFKARAAYAQMLDFLGWKQLAIATQEALLLDAGTLEANPFHSITFTHQLAVPDDGAPGVAFRLRSPAPLRIEYYDSSSGRLLAIDANGNGDFSEEGDLHLSNPSGVAAAWIPFTLPRTAVEIRIFALTREPLFPASKATVLSAEVHRDGIWTKAAEDVLD